MQQEDAAAVAQVLAGDQEAFRTLVDRHSRTLFKLAFRMTGNQHDADEVVQETFLRAYRRLGSFEQRASFATWIYRIAMNCALDLVENRNMHHRGRVQEGEEEEPAILRVPSPEPTPERRLLSGEIQQAVAAGLEQLTRAERTAFLMRHIERRSIEEIAEVLNVRTGSAKNCVFRAVQKMRRVLEPAMRSAV